MSKNVLFIQGTERESVPCCHEPPNLKPLSLIQSCHEPAQLPVVESMRSTFCFPASTMQYKSMSDILTLKYQWDTFERIENYNSVVYHTLANTLPVEAGSNINTPSFYQFQDSNEKTAYDIGHLTHTVIYPEVIDFLTPYSYKAIQYTSSITSTIQGTKYIYSGESTFCSNILPTVPSIDYNELLKNRVGLNLYVRVSTQISQFPKSPYKFSSNQEYITYNEYKRFFC